MLKYTATMGSLDKGDTSVVNINSFRPKVGDACIIIKSKIYLELSATAPTPDTTPRMNMFPRNILERITE
jgi:hypothetical protein